MGFSAPAVKRTTCGILHAYSYTDPDNGDDPPGARIENCRRLKAALDAEKA